MELSDGRREEYIVPAPPSGAPEEALNPPEGLDFPAEESGNPRAITQGEPDMDDNPASSAALAEPTNEVSLTPITGLEHLIRADRPQARRPGQAVAISYLRVSTTRQLNTGADIDADGNSIATQREWTTKKALEMRVPIAREFVEPGQSAQTIDKRPEFKKMLRYLDDHPEVKYVVIYMRSRVFRNHLDAAITKRRLREMGVELVSAKENFGDGYMGDAMEAITDVVNELQVRMSGEDIKIKMAHKVERGGSVGRAKLGYLNVRKDFDGRLVNTIDVDPARAPLIKWAFEQYATAKYSVRQLANMLEEQGLRTRPSPKRPASALSPNQLAVILGDPYYTGVIRYKGRLYPGRHEPLITKDLFLQVQSVLSQRNRRGDRDRDHFHFLRGLIYCADCYEEGRVSRLVYSMNTGNGGTYEYYICSAKLRDGSCAMKNARVADVEDRVARVVAREKLLPDALEGIRDAMRKALAEAQEVDQEQKEQLRKQLKSLEDQEARLIDLAAEGAIQSAKLRERLESITIERGAVTERLAQTIERIQSSADKAFAFIDLLEDPASLYASIDNNVRRDFLTALFEKIFIRVREEDLQLNGDRTELNGTIREWSALHPADAGEPDNRSNEEALRVSAEGSASYRNRLTQSKGLNKTVLVGLTGFEPATP